MAGKAGRRRARANGWRPWVVAGLGLAAVACGGEGGAPAPIRIGVLDNLDDIDGRGTVEAAKLAVALDAADGLEVAGRRRPVSLLFEDTATQPSEAVDGARRLIQSGAVAIVAVDISTECSITAVAAGESGTVRYRVTID